MSSDIHIHQASFGKPSNLADSLTIELCDTLIQFCEQKSEQNIPTYICAYPIDNNQLLSLNEHLINAVKHFQFSKKHYKYVYVNYFTAQFTLCPTNYYNLETSRSILEFNSGSIIDKLVLSDDVNTTIKLIYSIEESLKSTLDQVFPNHQIKHTLTTLSKLMLQSEELIKETILLSIHSNYIEVIVKEGTKLILANQFSIKTQEDVLYYVLFILEQYQLNPLTVSITIIGNIDSNAALIISLKKYIKHIRLALGHKNINWTEITGMPQHYNYSLLNRLFCE
jgi:hypothetical protein